MNDTPGNHPLLSLPLLGTVHTDTIVITWITMVVGLVFFAIIGASYRSHMRTKTQTVLEGGIDALSDLAFGVLGRNAETFVPFFVALFAFIFLLNQIGTVPFKELHFLWGGSPTSDLNTTAVLALLVFFLIQAVGIRRHGLGFYGHLANPRLGPGTVLIVALNTLDEILRPVTLALRLFGNIFAGEILLFIVASVIVQHVQVGPVNVSLAATVGPILVLLFNIFVGTLQAFVFTLLTIVYMSAAVADDAH